MYAFYEAARPDLLRCGRQTRKQCMCHSRSKRAGGIRGLRRCAHKSQLLASALPVFQKRVDFLLILPETRNVRSLPEASINTTELILVLIAYCLIPSFPIHISVQ